MPYLRVALVGLLVGALYGVGRVRSPAPPLIAMFGLAGMLVTTNLLGPP